MSQSSERAKAAKGPHIAPIYKRLPHGPHRLEREEVVRHQRTRIYGALVEAVAQNGYERTSVKQVISLAGVSRRSFYEQFANKEQCFLAAFDVIAGRDIKRLASAYANAGGGLDERLRASFRELARNARQNPKASLLVIVESQTAGTGGTLRLLRASATCEQMLARCFAESRSASALPMPIVRGIAGGLHGALATVLGDERGVRRPRLAEEMLRWTLLFAMPDAAPSYEQMSVRAARVMREISLTQAHGRIAEEPVPASAREQLLHHALRLGALHDYQELTAPQIADEARVPIDDFLELYPSKDACYLDALDMIADEIIAIVADEELVSSDWPHAVRRVVGRLMSYLSEHALYSRTIAQEAFFAGSEAVQQNLELTRTIATLLTEGAPSKPRSGMAVEGIAGAFMHTLRCQVVAGRVQLLPALSDYLAYIVLAPYLGAEAAGAIVSEDAVSCAAS